MRDTVGETIRAKTKLLCQRLGRIGPSNGPHRGHFGVFFFSHRHIMDTRIIDRPSKGALLHHMRGISGIAQILVAETLACFADQDPAFFERGPREQLTLWISDRRVALICSHIAQRCAKTFAPAHRVPGAAGCAEIFGRRDLWAITRDERGVCSKAVGGQQNLARANLFAVHNRAHHRACLDHQGFGLVANRDWNIAICHEPQEVIDQILPPAGTWRM